MPGKVRYETTGGAGDVPGPLTQGSDIEGTSTGSGLGPGTLDGLEVSFSDAPEPAEGGHETTDEEVTPGERLTREESRVASRSTFHKKADSDE